MAVLPDKFLTVSFLFFPGHSDSFDTYPHSDILTDNYRKWNADFRTPAEEKVQIPKIFTPYGFKYELPTNILFRVNQKQTF